MANERSEESLALQERLEGIYATEGFDLGRLLDEMERTWGRPVSPVPVMIHLGRLVPEFAFRTLRMLEEVDRLGGPEPVALVRDQMLAAHLRGDRA